MSVQRQFLAVSLAALSLAGSPVNLAHAQSTGDSHGEPVFEVPRVPITVITRLWPLRRPIEIPVREAFDTRPAPLVLWLGATIVAVVIGLYVVLW